MKLPLVAGAVLVGLLLRLRWVFEVIGADAVRFTGTDPYYHVRRIKLALENGFSIPSRDPLCHFPAGIADPWPPLFDLLVAGVAWLAGFGAPSERTIEVVAALTPVALGGVAIVLVNRLGRRLVGGKAAVIAAWVYATLPAVAYRSQAGVCDHHVAEALFALAVYTAVSGPARTGVIRRALSIGLSVAAAFLTWLGAVAFVATGAAWLMTRVVGTAGKPSSARLAAHGALGFALATVIVIPFAASTEAGRAGAFRTFHLSWLQVLELAWIALAFGALWGCAGWCGRGPRPWRRALSVTACVIVVPAAALLASPIRDGLLEGIAFARRPTPLLLLPRESQPLLFENGLFGFGRVWVFFGSAVFAALAGVLLVVWRSGRSPAGRRRLTARGLLLVTIVVHATLAILQARFVHFLAADVALWSAVFAVALGRRVGAAIAIPAFGVTVVGASVLLWFVRFGPNLPPPHVERALRHLREASPPVDPARPAYGVVAHWDLGHWLAELAQRPSLDSTFLHLADLERTASFFLAADEAELDRIADAQRIRYVVSLPIPQSQSSGEGPDPYRYLYPRQYAHVLGRAEADFLTPVRGGLAVTPAFTHTALFRLQYLNGVRPFGGHPGFPNLTRAHLDAPTLRGWRMAIAAESATNPGPQGRVKIFERVAGATVTGTFVPGAVMELRAVVRTPVDRLRFVYADRVKADREGRYTFRVPYWSRETDEAIGVDGEYEIFCPASPFKRRVRVTEADVREPRTVRVP